ncbi:MAG: GntR family transcriptional regulator [Bacteroidales bacterium]|nr:GntR family transcriptional regulator [Bacteroidales bacterium]
MTQGEKTLPPHKQIYEIIRQHIHEGVYTEGNLLPSEHDLTITHGVTRPTIRKALDRLQNEGYITKQQGKGSIVKGAPKGIGILSLRGTTSAVGQENLVTEIITPPVVRNWDEAFSYSLTQTEKEVGCIYFERLRLMNGKPVFFDVTMLPNINLPRFSMRNLENKSLFDVLRKNYQIEVSGGEQKIHAITADEKLQRHFNVEPGHPVVQLNRKIETNRYGFYIYSQVFCNTAEYALYGLF